MFVTDQNFETIMEYCLWAVPVVMAAGAAWPIFIPPRRIRLWPYFTRPLLGVLTAEAAVYALLFGLVHPLVEARYAAHHGAIIMDYPVTMLPSSFLFVGSAFISYLVFAIHAACRELFPDRHTHADKSSQRT